MGRQPTSFEEATKMYIDYFGVRPMLDDIASVYDTYMQRWREFDSFKKFLVYTIEGQKPISSEPTTFKEAYKMYFDYFGKFPRNSEIKKLYKTYQKCWRVFGSFKKYLMYAINTERTENHDTIR